MIELIGIPLAFIPVRHTCGHFEARFMRWNGDREAFARGFHLAGNECTTCTAGRDGRPINTAFPTLDAVQSHCATENAARNRNGFIL